MVTLHNFYAEGGGTSPTISLNVNGDIYIGGRSNLPNTIDFWSQPIKWMEIYSQNPAPITNIILDFDYINSGSCKCLVDFLKHFEKIDPSKTIKNVKWLVDREDEDMVELCDSIQSTHRFPIELVFISEDDREGMEIPKIIKKEVVEIKPVKEVKEIEIKNQKSKSGLTIEKYELATPIINEIKKLTEALENIRRIKINEGLYISQYQDGSGWQINLTGCDIKSDIEKLLEKKLKKAYKRLAEI